MILFVSHNVAHSECIVSVPKGSSELEGNQICQLLTNEEP